MTESATQVRCAVLYITDNDADYGLFSAILGDDPRVKIGRARSGEEALDLLRSRTSAIEPNLIITAWRLPRMSVLDLLSELKADEHLRALPVIVFTTTLPDDDVLAAYDAGVSSIVTKPHDLDGMTATLKTTMSLWVNYAQLPNCTDAIRSTRVPAAGLRSRV